LNGTQWAETGAPYVNKASGTTINGGQAFGMMSGGESMSRLGFKGTEDLGSGTKAIFDLEIGFNGNGSIANGPAGVSASNAAALQSGGTALQGQLFGRAAYAGLSNTTYGQLTAGRQQNLMLDNIGNYDPVNAQLFSPINFSGAYGGGGFTNDSRVTGLKYVWNGFGGFNANAVYAPGGVTGQTTAGTTTGLQFGYEASKFGVQAIASHTTDAQDFTGVSPTTTITAAQISGTSAVAIVPGNAVSVSVANTTAYMLTSKYNVTDKFTLKAGYERENIGTPSNYQAVAGAPATASGYAISSMSAAAYNKSLNVFWVGGNYQFTPAIKGSLGYYNATTLGYNANAVAAITPTAAQFAAAGTRSQYYSLLADYGLSKRTNLYAGVMFNNNSAGNGITSTGSNNANLITTSTTYGIGMRHAF